MNKKLLLTYVVTVAVLGVAAWLLYQSSDEDRDERRSEVLADPLWYRSIPKAEKLLAARYRLDNMTSNDLPPAELGPMKDEVALLCGDEAVVDAVVARFSERKTLSPAQLSAYMEIFARVRHRKFGALVADGLGEWRDVPHLNALDAAVVQRDPRLVPFLIEALIVRKGYYAQRIMKALASIGTGEAVNAVVKQIGSPDRDTAVFAISVAAGSRYAEAVAALAARLGDADPFLRAMAAWALGTLGQSRGREALIAQARDEKTPDDARAQCIQNLVLLGARDTVEELRPLTTLSAPLTRTEARVALATFRDPAFLKILRDDLTGPEEEARSEALIALGRSGADADLALVEENLPIIAQHDLAGFVRLLPVGNAPSAPDFLERLSRRPDTVGLEAMTALGKFGPRSLPNLARILEAETSRDRKTGLLNVVGGITDKKSLAVLEPYTTSSDRRIWRLARENYRLVEQRLLVE